MFGCGRDRWDEVTVWVPTADEPCVQCGHPCEQHNGPGGLCTHPIHRLEGEAFRDDGSYFPCHHWIHSEGGIYTLGPSGLEQLFGGTYKKEECELKASKTPFVKIVEENTLLDIHTIEPDAVALKLSFRGDGALRYVRQGRFSIPWPPLTKGPTMPEIPRKYPYPDRPWIDDAPRDDCQYCKANYSRCPSICTWCHEKVPCPDTTHRAFGDIVRWAPPDEPVQEWIVSSMHFYVGDKRAASLIHKGDSDETERMIKAKQSIDGRKNRYEIVAMDELEFVRRGEG